MQFSVCHAGKIAITGLLTISLAGCAAVDAYGSRASLYNEQTADQKSDMVLKNVLRSAYNQPLQFTDVSSISGTASSSFTFGASAPITGIRGTGTELTSLSPSATISGGPTFNVANLNTQEFYQGIQTPISNQLIANYLSEGYSPYVLYPLAVSQIEFNDGKTRRVYRSSGTPGGFAGFIGILRGLINAGITMEQVSNNKAIGSKLNSLQAADPELLGRIASALGTNKDTPVALQQVIKNGKPLKGSFELMKKEVQYRFCFNRNGAMLNKFTPDEAIVIEEPAKHNEKISVIFDGDVAAVKPFVLSPDNWCNQSAQSKSVNGKLGLQITTRSVEGMINFLGDLTNTELGLADPPHDLTIRSSVKYSRPIHFFSIREGKRSEEDILTSFNDRTYSVTPDPSGRDYSSLVLQIVTDFLALESSAKSFPAPNVITLVP